MAKLCCLYLPCDQTFLHYSIFVSGSNVGISLHFLFCKKTSGEIGALAATKKVLWWILLYRHYYKINCCKELLCDNFGQDGSDGNSSQQKLLKHGPNWSSSSKDAGSPKQTYLTLSEIWRREHWKMGISIKASEVYFQFHDNFATVLRTLPLMHKTKYRQFCTNLAQFATNLPSRTPFFLRILTQRPRKNLGGLAWCFSLDAWLRQGYSGNYYFLILEDIDLESSHSFESSGLASLDRTSAAAHLMSTSSRWMRRMAIEEFKCRMSLLSEFVLRCSSNLCCSIFGSAEPWGKGTTFSTPPICIPLCLPLFVSQFASHVHCSIFEKVFVIGITGKFPNGGVTTVGFWAVCPPSPEIGLFHPFLPCLQGPNST